MVQKSTRKKRHLQINKRKRKNETRRVAIGAAAYRRTIERRVSASTKIYIWRRKTKQSKAEQNKRNTRPEKNVMTSLQTKRPQDTSSRHLWLVNKPCWRANQHEPACFGLSSPWSFPSHIEGRLNDWPRLQRRRKDENEAKQNKGNAREIRHGRFRKPNARRIQVRVTCG